MGIQVSFEMFKRYEATHVKRQFTWLHAYNLAPTWRFRWASVGLRAVPHWPQVPTKQRVGTQVVWSIRSNTAAPRVPVRKWQLCAARINAEFVDPWVQLSSLTSCGNNVADFLAFLARVWPFVSTIHHGQGQEVTVQGGFLIIF